MISGPSELKVLGLILEGGALGLIFGTLQEVRDPETAASSLPCVHKSGVTQSA